MTTNKQQLPQYRGTESMYNISVIPRSMIPELVDDLAISFSGRIGSEFSLTKTPSMMHTTFEP